MDSKVCVLCKIQKSIDNFYNIYRECKQRNIKRSTRRYYENKDKISMQQKIYYEKNRDKLLQKQNDYSKKRSTDYKELQRSHVELQKQLKALEEKLKNEQVYSHIVMYVCTIITHINV